jgi:hypothetical protein
MSSRRKAREAEEDEEERAHILESATAHPKLDILDMSESVSRKTALEAGGGLVLHMEMNSKQSTRAFRA